MKAPAIERFALSGAAFWPATVDQERRTVDCLFLSGAPIQRVDPWSGEAFELVFDPNGADLARLNSGAAPVLNSHQDRPLEAQIGVVESAWRAGASFLARLRFSERADVEPLWRDVLAGVLRGVSGGFTIHEMTEDKDGRLMRRTATRWEPVELSLVTIPADPGAVTLSMTNQETGEPTMSTSATTAGAEPVQTNQNQATEIQRVLGAANLGTAFNENLMASNPTVDQVRTACFEEMFTRGNAHDTRVGISTATTMRDSSDMVRTGMLEALTARVSGKAPADIGRQWHGRRVTDMARELLAMRGVRTFGSDSQIVSESLMHSTSDFPNLLSGLANKMLLDAYTVAESGLKKAFRRSTVGDFKTKNVLRRGEFPALLKVQEGAQYTYGPIGENKESYALGTYGKIFSITRQALINDDLGAFSDMAHSIGQACAGFEANFLVGVITADGGAGPVMSDGVNLFHATHGNSGTGVIGVAALDAARTAMRTQKGLDGATIIDARPKFLICAAAKETTAQQVLTSITPAQVSNVNPFAGQLELIAEPRLDAKSAAKWYLFGDPDFVPAIEYAYLSGAEGPQIEQRVGFDIDGLEVKARLDFGAAAIDWRGCFISSGS